MAKRRGRKATPAQRAKARRDPAIFKPPKPIRGTNRTAIRDLRLSVGGRSYTLGGAVEGDTPWSMGVEQTGTISIPVRNPSGKLEAILTDEELLQRDGARITVDGVIYCVTTVEYDGEGLYTLTVEDEVSWRLSRFSTYRVADRKRTTRFGFIYGFVREASRKPYPPMHSFIPEVDDRQQIAHPRSST
jgi:hypothetical protein